MLLRIVIITFVSLQSVCSHGQITNPSTPKFEQFKPIELNGNKTYQPKVNQPSHTNRSKIGATADDIARQQNEQAKRLMMPSTSMTREARQKKSLDIVQALLAEQKKEKESRESNATMQEEELYLSAGRNICMMLWKKQAYSLKKAVWLAEAPYLRQQLSYNDYTNQIASIIEFCQSYAKELELDWTKHDNRARVLVDYFSKTIALQNGQVHKRLSYDFEDAYGRENYNPLMVAKLLRTNKGQCHSMPLLFKILADEMKVRAYICLSPAHSYIKLFLDNGSRPVFETTNGYLTDEK